MSHNLYIYVGTPLFTYLENLTKSKFSLGTGLFDSRVTIRGQEYSPTHSPGNPSGVKQFRSAMALTGLAVVGGGGGGAGGFLQQTLNVKGAMSI